jgi:hypothetical protein
MADHATPISYTIKFEKDHATVKATYDIIAPIGSLARIADFQVSVDGTGLISNFLPGQSRFSGAQFHNLPHPDQDASVSFTISSSEGWSAADSDLLRGPKTYDDTQFSG